MLQKPRVEDPLWRKHNSTHYSPNKYVLLTNMRETEGYDEVMLGTHRAKWKEDTVDKRKLCTNVVDMKPIKEILQLKSI